MNEHTRLVETVAIPRLNANEDQVLVVRVHVDEGDQVAVGDLLLELETTKATSELLAPAAGRVTGLAIREGQFAEVGARVCTLVPGTVAVDGAPPAEAVTADHGAPRITSKARRRAAELGVDLSLVTPANGRITVADVEAAAAPERDTPTPAVRDADITSARALVFGGGGHAAVVIEALLDRGYLFAGCVDDDDARHGREVLGAVAVVGGRDRLCALQAEGVDVAFIGVGGATSNHSRKAVYEMLVGQGFVLPSLIHPRAYVSAGSTIGPGSVVLPGAVIGPRCQVGANVIVNQGVQLCHDSEVGDHAHLAPGALIAANCRIGRAATIGMGASLLFGTRVGADALVHNNASVVSEVPAEVEVARDGRRTPRTDLADASGVGDG